MAFSRSSSMVSISCFIERAKRSSFHTINVSPLRANSSASRKARRSVIAPDNCSVKILSHPASASASRCKARFLVNGRNSRVAEQHAFRRSILARSRR
jgi:hypothetical protein